MTSMLRIGACTVALAFAAAMPALAQDDTMKKPVHHMHHGMMHKGHMGKMSKMGSKSEGDAAVAKLNEQSLQQAKEGAAPAGAMPASGASMSGGSMSGGSVPSASTGAMPSTSSGAMAPPAAPK